jgi:hypothetical protein
MRVVVCDLILAKDIQHANLYRRRGRSGELILIRDIRTGAEPRQNAHPGFLRHMGPSILVRLWAATSGPRSGDK